MRNALAAALCAAVLILAGWSNGGRGGDGFGTHDWVLYEANRLARAEGSTWLDWSVAQTATDDPDTVFRDSYYHVYDVWGSQYGDAPGRIQELYQETVVALRTGDRRRASKTFGLLSHYYADVCNPLHTDQTPAEESVHSSYELATQAHTDEPGENATWIVRRRFQATSDAGERARRAAQLAHESYTALVDAYRADRMDGQALGLTRAALSEASNGLAELLVSAGSHEASRTARSTGLDAGDPGGAVRASEETSTVAYTTAGIGRLLPWLVAAAVFAAALFGALSVTKKLSPPTAP